MNYEERILIKVDALIAQDPRLQPLHELFESYLTTYELGDMQFGATINDILQTSEIDKGSALYQKVLGIMDESSLYSRNIARSVQEYALVQSDKGEEGIEPVEKPYRIMALDKGVSIADIQLVRTRIKRRAFGLYFGLPDPDSFVRISVEPVNENGETIRDPVPLNEDGTLMDPFLWSYSDNFPFRRP